MTFCAGRRLVSSAIFFQHQPHRGSSCCLSGRWSWSKAGALNHQIECRVRMWGLKNTVHVLKSQHDSEIMVNSSIKAYPDWPRSGFRFLGSIILGPNELFSIFSFLYLVISPLKVYFWVYCKMYYIKVQSCDICVSLPFWHLSQISVDCW